MEKEQSTLRLKNSFGECHHCGYRLFDYAFKIATLYGDWKPQSDILYKIVNLERGEVKDFAILD